MSELGKADWHNAALQHWEDLQESGVGVVKEGAAFLWE